MPSFLSTGDPLLTSAPIAVAQQSLVLLEHLMASNRAMSLITTTFYTVASGAQPCGAVWSNVPTW